MRTSSTKIFRWNLILQYTLTNMTQRKGVVFLKLFFFHFIVFFFFFDYIYLFCPGHVFSNFSLFFLFKLFFNLENFLFLKMKINSSIILHLKFESVFYCVHWVFVQNVWKTKIISLKNVFFHIFSTALLHKYNKKFI